MSLEQSDGCVYSHWTHFMLKKELGIRGLPVSGKKAALIDRLLTSDRYFHLHMYSEETVEAAMTLPAKDSYKDVNANSPLPDFSRENIDISLDRFQKSDDGGEKLYRSSFLMFVRASPQIAATYFYTQCHADMKGSFYYVNVRIHKDGHTGETNCECAVGSGVIAHCKHVIAVLYAIKDMKEEGKMKLHLSCTQQLQTFHKPKKTFKGSPLKAAGMSRPTATVKFSAVPPKFKTEAFEIRRRRYNDRVQNIFSTSNLNLSIKQRNGPANPHGILHDHDSYCARKFQDDLLRSLGIQDVSAEHIAEVEFSIRSQSKCDRWENERTIRITATNFKRVCRARPESWEKLSLGLLHPREFRTTATEYSIENEAKALKKYSETFGGLQLQKVGLCVSASHPYLASSPDAFLSDETFVEVKCSYRARSEKIDDTICDFLTRDEEGNLVLDSNHWYGYQMQGQYFTTGKKYGSLVIYNQEEVVVVGVKRDVNFISEMVSHLQYFYKNYHKEQIIKEYLFGELNRYEVIECRHNGFTV